MDPKPKSHIAEYAIGAGYVIWFCLALAVCFAFYYFTFVQPPSPPANAFATSLPPTTATPHLLPATRQASEKIIVDSFNDDKHRWGYSDSTARVEVKNGKLVVVALKEDSIAIAACDIGLCALADQSYFLQADFSTDVETDHGFGILFNRFNNADNFFLFEISPAAKTYRLYHHISDSWSLRIGGESLLIKSFPAVNTLAIYVNGDTVELYINEKIVDSYTESKRSFDREQFAFCSEGTGYKLFIDNLSISR